MRATERPSPGTGIAMRRPRPAARAGDPFDTSAIVCEAAERQYLAGVLDLLGPDCEPSRVRDLVGMLTPSMFKADGYGDVFDAVSEAVTSHNRPTLADVLTAIRRQAKALGAEPSAEPLRDLVVDLVADTINTGPQAARLAADAAGEILEAHSRRRCIEVAADCVRGLHSNTATADDLAAIARELDAVRVAAASAGRNKPVTFIDAVEAWARHEQTPAVRTLLQPFDEATEGGLPVGGITAFVAPPAIGKSALALQLCVGAMLADDDLRVVYGLGEMTPQALARRAACVGAGLLGMSPVTMHDAGQRSRQARDTLVAMANRIGDRLTIIPPPLTVERIDDEIVRTGARVAVIDYLQLMHGDGNDRVQELDGIIGRLRQTAVTREAAMVVISSMAKAAGPGSRIGQFARGSGEVDYACELFYVGVAADRADEHGIIDVTWQCKKARNLAERDIELRFDGACQTFAAAVVPFTEFNGHSL
jgi:replicative DNA helicase